MLLFGNKVYYFYLTFYYMQMIGYTEPTAVVKIQVH